MRLDRFVTTHTQPFTKKAVAKQHIASGLVSVNGTVATDPGFQVFTGNGGLVRIYK